MPRTNKRYKKTANPFFSILKMNKLPHFIHENIYNYLSIKQQQNYTQTSKYLNNTLEKSHWKILNMNYSDFPPDIRQKGKYIKLIKFSTEIIDMIIFGLKDLCPNLRHLCIMGRITKLEWKYIIKHYSDKLHSFTWEESDFEVTLEPLNFTKFSKLEMVVLNFNYTRDLSLIVDTLDSLNKLNKLDKLILNVKRYSLDIIQCIQKLNVSYLNLQGRISAVNLLEFNKIELPNLEHLTLDEVLLDHGDEEILLLDKNKFPKLKSLNLSPDYCYESTIQLQTDFLLNWNKLQKLNMRPYFNTMVNESLFNLAQLNMLAIHQAILDNNFLNKLFNNLPLLSSLALVSCTSDDLIFKDLAVNFKLKHLKLKQIPMDKYALEWLSLCLPNLRWFHFSCYPKIPHQIVHIFKQDLYCPNLQFFYINELRTYPKEFIKAFLDNSPNLISVLSGKELNLENEYKNVDFFIEQSSLTNRFPSDFFTSMDFTYAQDERSFVLNQI